MNWFYKRTYNIGSFGVLFNLVTDDYIKVTKKTRKSFFIAYLRDLDHL